MMSLDDFDPAPARLTEWSVYAPPAAAQPHPAPPSHNQEAHLTDFRRTPGTDWPKRWYAVTLDLPGELDEAALSAALTGFVARHDALRSGFRFEADGTPERWVIPAEQIRLERHDVGHLATGREVLDHLGDTFDRNTDPARWPAYRFVTLQGSDACTVILAFDHSVTDMYSLAMCVDEVAELYAGRESSLPAPGSFVDYCTRERELPAGLSAEVCADAERRWRAVLGAPEPPRFPLDLGVPAGTRRTQRWDEFVLADADMADLFTRRCRAESVSVTAGLFAALALADGRRVFRTIVPVHTRDEGSAVSFGWFVNGLPMAFDVPADRDFGTAARSAEAAFRAGLRFRDLPSQGVIDKFPADLRERPSSWLSYIDYRRMPGSERHAAWRMCVFTSERSGADADIWVNRTWEGLQAQLRYPDTVAARESVRSYLDGYAAVIAAVTRDQAVLEAGDGGTGVPGKVKVLT